MADEPFGRKSTVRGSTVNMSVRHLIVEGQTEQQFAERVLVQLAASKGIYVITNPPTTGTHNRGISARGGGAWKHMVDPARNFLRNPGIDKVGVLFDVYGSEFQKMHSELVGSELRNAVKRDATESILKGLDVDESKLVVGPVLYEFETLVIAALASGTTREKPSVVREARAALTQAHGDVEAIDGSVVTSPSHRVTKWWEDKLGKRYEKQIDGPRILNEVPWPILKEACPTFAQWVDEFLD